MKPSLKDHQNAMAALLASGSAIPTSASRLAHAVYDMLAVMNSTPAAPVAHTERRSDATTSGLNDAALAYEIGKAARPTTVSDSGRIKQLENTIRQLRESNKELRGERNWLKTRLEEALTLINAATAESFTPDQAGCRKEDTQDDGWITWEGGHCPVGNVVRVEVRFRDGSYDYNAVAEYWEWDHAGLGVDIVAYRKARP